jgi:hypothetical protein
MTTVNESALRNLLQRALTHRQPNTRFRAILAEYQQLACRACGEAEVSVHPEPGWGVTVMCERQGCQAAHSVLL